MKHLKIFLTFVMAVMLFNINNAASVMTASNTASISWHAMPKNQVKKKKELKEKRKKENRSLFYKTMGDGSGMSTAGFVLGLLGLIFCWVPYLGLILCVLGIIFGALGVTKRLKGLAIAGLVMGLVGGIIALLVTSLFV